MLSLSDNNQADVLNLDDLHNIENPYFEQNVR